MHLTTEALVADPQSTTGWRRQRLINATTAAFSNYRRSGTPAMVAAFGEGELPHLGLAHQYLNHFRCQSDYRSCSTEQPCRWVCAPGCSTSTAVLDLPEGASFQFVEIQARSLAEHRTWVELLDQAMRRDALIPAATQQAPRTATEISMAASHLCIAAEPGDSEGLDVLLAAAYWCAITGELLPVQEGPALLVEISPLAPSPKPQPTVSEMLPAGMGSLSR